MNAKNNSKSIPTTGRTTQKEIAMNTMFNSKTGDFTASISGEPLLGFSGKVYLPFTGMYYTPKTAAHVLVAHDLDFTLEDSETLIEDIDFQEWDDIDNAPRVHGALVYRYSTFLGSEVVIITGPNHVKLFPSLEAYNVWKSSVKAVVAR